MPGASRWSIFSQLLLLGALLGSGFSPAHAAIEDYPFRLVITASGAGHEVMAENDGAAPIAVHVTLTGKQFVSDRNWPLTINVPPRTAVPLGRVDPAGRSARGYSFNFRYSHHFGRFDAVHESDAAYRFPFEDGRGFAVSQAYGGMLSSHNNRAAMYAVDFAMPVGNAVIAARGGIVADVTLRYNEGGDDLRYLDRANRITIVHDDGTVAEYGHLSPGPESVAAGQQVVAGDLLGYSGITGYTAGPHLHFIVSRPSVTNGRIGLESVPVLFYSSDPAVRFSAQAGTTAWANYSTTVTAIGPAAPSRNQTGATQNSTTLSRAEESR